jgi:poly-gamma-glutamate capsule biosynthesis protein CapA/YwtB (metallophosphatase superfamily)
MKLVLTGDVNLMNVTDPSIPFARVADELTDALVFSNLECCLFDPGGHSVHNEGFYAHPGPGGEALKRAGIAAVGIANNVNYGETAIHASLARLDALGVAHTGAGRNLDEARAPALVTRDGIACGFLQRSSVYWPTNHEAGKETTGIAVLRGHTAYHVPMYKTRPEIPPPNRPGVPPDIVTWADAGYLRAFTDDIAALKTRADVVVASCHWGLGQEVLAYMSEIAHAAIEAGADIVMGHGPHYSLPVEIYKGRAIFYGLGSFSFHTGHGGRQHGDWLGMMVRAEVARDGVKQATFQFVRHNARNETVLCALADEKASFEDLARRSAQLGARFIAQGEEVLVEPL